MGDFIIDITPKQTEHRYRGIGRFTAELERAIRLNDNEMRYSFLGIGHKSRPSEGMHEYWKPSWPKYHLEWFYNEILLRRKLSSLKPSIYLSLDPYSSVVSGRYPTVVTVYDLIPLKWESKIYRNFSIDQKFGYRWYLRNVRNARHVLTISHTSKRDIVSLLGVSEDKVTVIYPGLSPLEYRNGYVEDQVPSDKYILFVGSTEFHKQLHTVIKAFRLIRQHVPDLDLILVGKWSEEQQIAIRNSVDPSDSPSVLMLNHVSNAMLKSLYSRAEAFVFPSLAEGFGLPLIEAMSCRTPVICADTPINSEIVGNSAVFFKAGDHSDLADTVVSLLNDEMLKSILRTRGVTTASKYSWEQTAKQVCHLLERLV